MQSKRSKNGGESDTFFVHSGFRTSSTWLWLKLRQVDGVRAYYEPFNELLASMSKFEAGSLNPGTWNSHHPTSDPYFLEFIDLINEQGGIKNYQTEMSFEGYIPINGVDGDLSAYEEDYISLLIGSAHEAGRRPALCAVRSLGRSRAIHKKFGGTHLLLTRNLHEQWCSFSEQAADGNNYFFDIFFRQVECCKHDPFLRHLVETLTKRGRRSEVSEQYVLFLLSQLYLNAVAFDVCQIKIDVTEIGNRAATREEAEIGLSQALGSKIDLRDVQAHVSYSSLDAKSRNSVEKIARQLLSEMFIPNASAECGKYVQEAFEDAFRCWDNAIYYGEASKNFLSQKFKRERIRATDEVARLNAMCSHNQAELAGAKHDLSRLLDEIQHRPRPMWEMLIFRRSGRPRKVFHRMLFHTSGKPRGIFRKWILKPDGRPRWAFRQWMTGPDYLWHSWPASQQMDAALEPEEQIIGFDPHRPRPVGLPAGVMTIEELAAMADHSSNDVR
jgi:hypothetical protein